MTSTLRVTLNTLSNRVVVSKTRTFKRCPYSENTFIDEFFTTIITDKVSST